MKKKLSKKTRTNAIVGGQVGLKRGAIRNRFMTVFFHRLVYYVLVCIYEVIQKLRQGKWGKIHIKNNT